LALGVNTVTERFFPLGCVIFISAPLPPPSRLSSLVLDYETLRRCSADLYWRALTILPRDVLLHLEAARRSEEEPMAKSVLDTMLKNAQVASQRGLIICQDTGFPVFLLELGAGCSLACNPVEALSSGIEDATRRHHLRANCVEPLSRANTGTNRGRDYPIVHAAFWDQEGKARITLLAKGSGSESRSALAMLNPVEGFHGIMEFVLRTVATGAARSCPPVVVGVGIGGSFDSVAFLSKLALFRPIGRKNPDPRLASMESDLLEKINHLGIGPMGLGGKSTALWVSVESADTHITCNPVAVNMSCWAHRRAAALITSSGYEVLQD